MTLSQLKPGQKILHNGNPSTFHGVRTVKARIGKVSKIIIEGESGSQTQLPLSDGPKTLEDLNIKLEEHGIPQD